VISVAIDIAEATEHEQRVLAIFEQAPVAITLSRQSDGVFLKANRTFLELMGYTQEEVTGSSAIALELWHPPQSRDTMLAELQSKGHVRNLIAGYRKKSGQTGRLLVSVEPIQVGGEKMMLGIMTDISGLEEARQALALSEARYKLLSEASFEGVGLARDGIVVDANAQIAHILGVSREDLIGKPVTGNMKPRDEPGALLTFQREGDSSKEYEYLRPDGSSVIVEVRSKDLEHAGEMLRISAVRDVTEKKQKELALLNLQLRFALMMDSNVVGIFIAGLDGRIFEANDYFLNMLGLDRQALEAGELNWQSLTAPDTLEITVKSVHDMAQNGGNLPYEKTYLHADGHRVPALVALSRLSSEPTRGIVIVLDISDLKSTQSALLERTRAAERAEAAKTLFLSSVSHELRTPLHTMLGHVRLMRKKASGEDLQQLSVVERSSTHLLRLIEDLLEYNHSTIAPERLEPEVVVVRGFLANLQLIGNAATVDSDNQFFLQLSDGLPATLVVDEVRLTQVLRILIDNACKYTRAGVLIFSLSMEGELRLVDGTQRCGLRFSVEDNGRGIDAADVRHIFEPLRRGSNATDLHGLGLGLAIAAQWIERMGSTIGVETSRGFGSHFSFLLDLEVGFEAVPSKRELLFGIHSLLQTPQAKLSFLPLPEEDIHALGELIRMGRLGRLRDWAHALEMRHPQHRDAAVVVGELAANADLDALEKLHGRWAALSYQEE
jgi:PAS domain S-box-containing protein